jgi:sulfite exporter TauE/SafE
MGSQDMLSGLLASGLAGCGHLAAAHGGLLASLFLAGLLGSPTHCAGMCGPFVLGQVGGRLAGMRAGPGGELRRLRGALLLPYHLGRLTTYAGLAAVAASAAGGIARLIDARAVSASLLALAALGFLMVGAARLGLVHASGGAAGRRWAALVSRLSRPLLAPGAWRGYALGLLLGFIPCGLLYGALAAAAASASPGAAALAMLAFGLGTVPMLVAVGFLGDWIGRWRNLAARLAPAIMIVNAGLLLVLAWRWMA